MRKLRYKTASRSFYGWYFKCTTSEGTIAFIAATHGGENTTTCSIQVIYSWKGSEGEFSVEYPGSEYSQTDKSITIAGNSFGEDGIKVDIVKDGNNVCGEVRFENLTPLSYDIMGPFSYIPFMECRHMVGSIQHKVNGTFKLNGIDCDFKDGSGYWEGDSGVSFPKKYIWTHADFEMGDGKGSLMLSVAKIPFGFLRFTGVIAFVNYGGEEYRLATYLGAKARITEKCEVIIIQGDKMLYAHCSGRKGQELKAPLKGNMERTIRENIACEAEYLFTIGDEVIVNFKTNRASFEFEW